MRKCPHCGTAYNEGDMVDIGIGFQQISPDRPDCDCKYIEYMKKEELKNKAFAQNVGM